MVQPFVALDYVKQFGWDKLGRPVLWFRMSNYNPAVSADCELLTRWCVFLLDYVNSIIKPNVDQFIAVVNLKDFAYANFSLE